MDACEVYIMSSSRVKLYNGLSQDQKTKKKQKVARKGDVILVSTLERGTNNVLQGHHTPTYGPHMRVPLKYRARSVQH